MTLRTLLAVASLLLAHYACGAPTALPDQAWSHLAPHPRLFASAEKWTELKTQVTQDPVSQRLFELIRLRAETVLTLPSLNLPSKGINLHGPMRQMQGRIGILAMTYKLTGDARFLTRARQEMRELAETPHWRPGHFLSTSEATVAMSLGLDWLYDELTVPERDACAAAIVEKGLKPSLEAEDKKETWLISGGNWGPVCNGGMAIGALTIAERDPALARRIVNRSIANVSYAAAKYAPAGAHSEGPGYWAYGTNFYMMLADALRTSLGTTCDLEKAPGMLRTGDYNLQMTAPTGDMFDYGDSVPDFGFEPVMFWFARELRGRYLVDPTLARLDELRPILISDGAQPDASRLQPLALIWWDPKLSAGAAAAPGPLVWWSEGGPQPQAVMRSSWRDRRAAFVGIKAGKCDEAHAHMDMGSFVYEVNGVRWAVDLGRDQYSGPRKNGLGDDLFRATQDSKRWAIFNDGPDSHNILRFNRAAPWVDARTELRPAKAPEASPGFVVELSPAYEGQVAKVQRGLSLRPDRSLVIRDEWSTGARPAAVAWQWMTLAQVKLEANRAILTQNGETLEVRVVSPANAHLAVEDFSKAPNPWDSDLPGRKRITVRVGTASQTAGELVIVARPLNADFKADPVCSLPLARW